MRIAAIIPAYKVENTIKQLVLSIPEIVNIIIVVDDNCPRGSGKEVESIKNERTRIIYNKQNMGVGGAVITGYRMALDMGCDICVKVDGDGQMDPEYIACLIEPLIQNEADYVKGNRFNDFCSLKTMPYIRLLGNSILSFIIKVVSGYWNIIDPTNGFTAIHSRALEKLDLNKISGDYFFESSMLINLNIANAVVKDIGISARYGDEISSLSISKVALQFPPKLLHGLLRRIFIKYFISDFNMGSVYLLFGFPLFMFGLVFGIMEWHDSIVSGAPKTAGTIMLVALPIILGFQMLLEAIHIDINSNPKKAR